MYVFPVNYTDSTGHFIDTLWDIADLGADLRNCLGDTDALSCYMLPVDVAAVVLPVLTGVGGADNAIRAARGADDSNIIIFYHGTRSEHVSAFDQGGKIGVTGKEGVQDFGEAFYATRQEMEAIGWAGDRASPGLSDRYVIAIEMKKARFDTLKGNTTTPWEYFYGVSVEDYHKGIRKTQAEIDAHNFSFDYIYGPVSTDPSWEQFAFKSAKALEVLNTSPRSIYKVSTQNQLHLLKRIIP